MTDELQQARADVLNPANLIGQRAGYEWVERVDPARVDHLIEVATREYREALEGGRMALVDAAQALDYAARHCDGWVMGPIAKARDKALDDASALLPQPVPTAQPGFPDRITLVGGNPVMFPQHPNEQPVPTQGAGE